MNILYYVPNFSKAWGGVYQYALSLFKSLAEDTTYKNQFYLYLLNEDENFLELANTYENVHLILEADRPTKKEYFLAEKKEPYRIVEPPLIKTTKKTSGIKRFIAVRYNYRLIRRYQELGYQEMTFLDWIIRKNQIEVIHCPFQSIYTVDDIPAITTMHDVQELYFPQFFSSSERANRAVHYKHAIDKASAVVVSYSHIKNDIVRFFEKPVDQVHVCLLDMKDLWFEKFRDKDILDLEEYNLPAKFILYPASTWEHKNHIGLLKAIHYLKQERNFDVFLVATGHKNGFYKSIEQTIVSLGLEENVCFPGLVSDQVLFSLYKKACAVVVPTLYEAGSFPLMESMLMDIPVVCSSVTSLPETINNMKFVFNPLDPQDIGEKIQNILTNPEYIRENKENNRLQAFKLKDNKVSEKINCIYKQLRQLT